MNKQILKGNWKQTKGKVKKLWGKITDDELDEIEGDYDQLVGLLQKKYGYTLEEAKKKVESNLDKLIKKAS